MRLNLEDGPAPDGEAFDPALSQWMTPAWVAEAIVAHAFDGRNPRTVIEPSCGIGRFLNALPDAVRAIGVELDPALADRARIETGREVVTGDFRTVDLPVDRADMVIGNPPFRMDVLDGMLARCHRLLDEGGAVVMVLPAFTFQTTSRVARYNSRWTMSHVMLPRSIFPGIRLPLTLGTFVKDSAPRLIGFLLYDEAREVEEMPAVYRRALSEGRSGWAAVVGEALTRLGGEATVEQVCAEISPRRPTRTAHWRAQVRKQLTTRFVRTSRATYARAA